MPEKAKNGDVHFSPSRRPRYMHNVHAKKFMRIPYMEVFFISTSSFLGKQI